MSTEQQRQRVSALMDGEVGRFEAAAAVNDLVRTPSLAHHWERWHLIGRALRQEPTRLDMRNIAAHVREQIAGQTAREAGEQPTPAFGAAEWLQSSARRWRGALNTPVAGAIAASVLVLALAVFFTTPFFSTPAPDQNAIAPGFAAGAGTSDRWQQADPAVRAHLDRLLVNHQEQAISVGRSGAAAYVAVIGYERRP